MFSVSEDYYHWLLFNHFCETLCLSDQPEYTVDPSFTVNEGNSFNLSTLNLDANPTPGAGNFTWTFNDQPLVEQPGVELGVNSLLINSVLRNQSGVYMIESFNRAGSGDASFALNVNCKLMCS